MTVLGCDVSFYQDSPTTPRQIDFNVMRGAGASFVIIRAGQNAWVDSDFAYNWREAKGKLPRGSYWFYDSRSTPQSQARLWINTLGDDLGELPLFADFEERYGGNYGGASNFKKFIEELKLLAPEKEIIIYTAYYYWRETVGVDPVALAYWKQYKLWIANYNTNAPLIPAPWTTWEFWQYTDNGDGLKYGVESLNIDLNNYNGTQAEFEARYGVTTTPPIVPPAAYAGKVVTNAVNIRTSPRGVATGKYLRLGDTITADKRDVQWLHLTSINGVPVTDEWWASAGVNQEYIKWWAVSVYPPLPPPPLSVTAALEQGRAGTLVTDHFSKLWGYKPRRPSQTLASYPQTSVFNHVPKTGKGARLPITLKVFAKVLSLNGINAFRLWIPAAGWINSPNESPNVDKISPTTERLSWAANHVIILEERGNFYRVYAQDCNGALDETFFTKNGRFVTHKFNAIHKLGLMLKYGKGIDLYTPFTTDGEMWISKDEVQLWPALPFVLGDGTQIIKYELQGFKYYGIRADGTTVLLRDETGFKTNWKLRIPEVPI